MRLLSRLTYSNVMATLAIFIALGGASYAATNLSKNSVGTKQIKKNAVTSAKIKKKSISKSKMQPKLLKSITNNAKQKVLNRNGSVLGAYAGSYPAAPFAIFQVLVDGGLYLYYGSGQLLPLGSGSPSFKNNTCTGTAYFETDQDSFDFIFSKLAGGPSRVVYRTATGPMTLGPISAWKYTKTSQDVVGQNVWELDSGGNCVVSGSSPYTGVLGRLKSVPAPPDGVGPLKIR